MNNHTLNDLERNCLLHMNQNGIFFDGPIQLDGNIHRFSRDMNKKKKDEWYVARSWVFQENDYLVMCYGSWSDPEAKFQYQSWKDDFYLSHSIEERMALQQHLKEINLAAEKERLKRHEEAAIEANEIWNKASATPNTDQHKAYLRLKNVKAYNVRFGKNLKGYDALIIPLRNVEDKIRSLQFISVNQFDGSVYKLFLPGGEKKGCFFEIGIIAGSDFIYVSEGYASGASIHQAMDSPVVIAFDCGNIESVIAILKVKYPNNRIIIAGDDDVERENNPGRNKAIAVAKKYGCGVGFPQFFLDYRLKNGKRPTDFNDLLAISGVEELKRQLLEISFSVDLPSKVAQGIIQKQHPTERYSLLALPLCLKNYLSEMGQFSNADPIMTTSAVVSTISGFFKTNHLIPDNEYFQNLFANVWILNILESGGFKSTALNLGNAIARKKHTQLVKIIKEQESASGGKGSRKKEDGHIEKWIDKEYAEILKSDVMLPNLTTGPGLIEDISRGRGGTIFHHEFSTWLSNLEKTYNEGLKSLFTALYDVPDSFDQKTKGDGTLRIEKPFISICGVSTIDWIKDQIKPSDVDSGFFARFLLFLPVSINETPPALPKKKDRSTLLSAQERIEDILNTAAMQYRVYKLPEETKELFETIHEEMYKDSKNYSEKAQAVLDPYLKRWSPYILKLAIIFQPFFEADRGSLKQSDFAIWPESISAALSIVELAIKSTAFLFDTELGESEMQRNCRKVLQYIAKCGGTVLRHKLLSSKILSGGKPSYDFVLEMLEESGLIGRSSNPVKKDEGYFLIKPD